MQVTKKDVTSVSDADGEIVADKAGILTVSDELGEWLIRVHGFERFIAPPEKTETAAQKKKREAAEKPSE